MFVTVMMCVAPLFMSICMFCKNKGVWLHHGEFSPRGVAALPACDCGDMHCTTHWLLTAHAHMPAEKTASTQQDNGYSD